jgi:hypothetical protein
MGSDRIRRRSNALIFIIVETSVVLSLVKSAATLVELPGVSAVSAVPGISRIPGVSVSS